MLKLNSKFIKNIAAVLAVFSIILAMSLSSRAAYPSVKVLVDNKELSQSGVMFNGATLVPMRAIFEALGAEVKWQGATRTITAIKDSTTIVLALGKTDASINGEAKQLSAPAVSIDGLTMVPLRFIGEALGAEVKWESASKTVYVNSKKDAGLAIEELIVSPRRVLKTGDTLSVQMRGEAGCKASFDIIGFRNNIPMHEEQAGVYSGSLTVIKNMKVSDGVLIGRLQKDDKEGSKEAAQSVTINSVSSATADSSLSSNETLSKVFTNITPAPNSSVYRANIVKAEFVNKISEGSVRLFLDDKEITASCTYDTHSISGAPEKGISAGKHSAKVLGTDNEGQKIDYSWTFTSQNKSSADGSQAYELTLKVPEANEKIGTTLHLVGATAPKASVKFEIIGKASVMNLITIKGKAISVETTANSQGLFETKVDVSSLRTGTVVTINGEAYLDGAKVASCSRTVTRE
ncbi:MAG: copper amine oxidase N-terminal domain-containing protein [Candidatus Bruticola sp.]